jgi:hypothetical protein
MRAAYVVLSSFLLAASAAAGLLVGCNKKESSPEAVPADPVPLRCPAGSVVQDAACVAVVTAAQVQAVALQQTKLDELAQLLAKGDVVLAPVELLAGVRESAVWKKLAARSESLASAEEVMASLGVAASELRGLKDELAKASTNLGELKGELEGVMVEGGAARKLADVQERVSREVREVVGPLQRQVKSTADKVGAPLVAKLGELGETVSDACSVSKVTGSNETLKAACGKAKDAFGQAVAFLTDVKDRPAAMFQEVTGQLEGLGSLVDEETRGAVDRARTAVQAAVAQPTREPTDPVGTPATKGRGASGGGGGGGVAPSAPSGGGDAGGGEVSALGQPCGAGDRCGGGATCQTYYGFAGPSGPSFKSCEIPCGPAGKACPAGTTCVTVSDGPGQVCRAP